MENCPLVLEILDSRCVLKLFVLGYCKSIVNTQCEPTKDLKEEFDFEVTLVLHILLKVFYLNIFVTLDLEHLMILH